MIVLPVHHHVLQAGKLIFLLFFSLASLSLLAQISTSTAPYSFSHSGLIENVPVKILPKIDRQQLEQEDQEDEANGLPPRFGKPFDVNFNLQNSGLWSTVENNARIWRLKIRCPEALSINFLYEDFYLPKGATLHIYNTKKTHIIGAFTSVNNKSDGRFATGLVYGDEVVLEYYEPATVAGQGRIQLSTIVHGYRYIDVPEFAGDPKSFGDSGPCNRDVACPEGNAWTDEKKAVAVILVNGFRNCTGALVANTSGDCDPLFITANHCLGSRDAINNPVANTWSFLWRYESPSCGGGDGPTNFSTVGATVLANSGNPGSVKDSDFAVLRLAESPVDAGYDVYFAGWDARNVVPQGVTGIHHPAGDVKKISIDNDPLTSTNYFATSGTTHWRVAAWDSGTTEGGSSGSPIFNNESHRIVGHLSGGNAACSGAQDNDQPDWYGQTSYSWLNNGATDPRRRMQDWLSPNTTAITTLNGYYCGQNMLGSCERPITASCGGLYTGTTASGENNYQSYPFNGASNNNKTGPEVVYSFIATFDGELTVNLTNLSANLDLFLLEDCNPANSVVAVSKNTGTSNEQIIFSVTTGSAYHIIIDGHSGAVGSYTLSVQCPKPDCTTPTSLLCGEVLGATTSSGTNNFTNYNGAGLVGNNQWVAPELVYTFTLNAAATVEVNVLDLGPDLDLFITQSCNPNAVLAYSIGTNPEKITTTLPAGTYYLIIDGTTTGGAFSMSFNCTEALPLTLVEFQGKAFAEGNLLYWITGTEKNTAAHILERAAHPKDSFKEIGKVAAAGFSSKALSYEYWDRQPLEVGYYRLRTIDLDQSEQVSEIIRVERSTKPKDIQLWPVPASDVVTLAITNKTAESATVIITDISGKTVQTEIFALQKGENQFPVEVSTLAPGVYYLTLRTTSGQQEYAKLVKQ